MTEDTDYSTLPPLPQGDDICSQAVRSVYSRGFYEPPHVSEQYLLATAQFGRLVEEAGELIEVIVTMKTEQIADECADVMIVLCQLGWLYGMNIDGLLTNGRVLPPSMHLSVALGKTWRSIRKNDGFGVCQLIMGMADYIRMVTQDNGIDIVSAIWRKLAKDEKRGVRHEQG